MAAFGLMLIFLQARCSTLINGDGIHTKCACAMQLYTPIASLRLNIIPQVATSGGNCPLYSYCVVIGRLLSEAFSAKSVTVT